jgi:hypothetical protein
MVNSPEALAVAPKPLACAVAGLDSVLKLMAGPYPVPEAFVA